MLFSYGGNLNLIEKEVGAHIHSERRSTVQGCRGSNGLCCWLNLIKKEVRCPNKTVSGAVNTSKLQRWHWLMPNAYDGQLNLIEKEV